MPTWSQVAQVTLLREWQFLPSTESKILLLRQIPPVIPTVSKISKGHVARAIQVNGVWQFWGHRRIFSNAEPLVLDFRQQPPPMEGAILAIRYWQKPTPPWVVAIDIPDGGYDEPDIPLVQCINDLEIPPTFDFDEITQ